MVFLLCILCGAYCFCLEWTQKCNRRSHLEQIKYRKTIRRLGWSHRPSGGAFHTCTDPLAGGRELVNPSHFGFLGIVNTLPSYPATARYPVTPLCKLWCTFWLSALFTFYCYLWFPLGLYRSGHNVEVITLWIYSTLIELSQSYCDFYVIHSLYNAYAAKLIGVFSAERKTFMQLFSVRLYSLM